MQKNKALRVTFFSALLNIFLSIIKIIFGYIGNSYALIVDGIHSFSDLFSDIIVYITFLYSFKDKDKKFHWGYKKIESLSQLIMSIFLIFIALYISYKAVFILLNKDVNHIKLYLVWVVILTILVKEYIFYITIKAAKELNNHLLIANAWHHRSDSLTSIAVLVGLLLNYYFTNMWYIDSLLSILISGIIINIGFSILFKSLDALLDKAPPEKFQKALFSFLDELSYIKSYHKVRMRYLSSEDIYLDFHILVDKDMTIQQAHDIAGKLKSELFKKFKNLKDIIIHIEPYL